MNQIAALLNGELADSERERVLEEISQDNESAEILAALSLCPGLDLDESDLPFPIEAKIRVGCDQGFFRVFSMDGLSLAGNAAKTSRLIEVVSVGILPTCVSEYIDLTLGQSESLPPVRLRTDRTSGQSSLSIDYRRAIGPESYLEVWENGRLNQVSPGRDLVVYQFSVGTQGVVLAIRESDSLAGLGLRIVPMTFTAAEWTAAAIACATAGSYVQALTLLNDQLGRFPSIQGFRDKVAASLTFLQGFTRTEGFRVLAMDRVRSRTVSALDRYRQFGPIWEEIRNDCPELLSLPDDWIDQEPLPEAWLADSLQASRLARGFHQLVHGETVAIPGDSGSFDRSESIKWGLLMGAQRLRDGDFPGAEEVFRNLSMTSDDSILAIAQALSLHLKGCDGAEAETLWSKVFRPLIEAQKSAPR